MDLTLVVLAAGMGSRWGGLKQMEPVGPSGEFLLDYGVYDAVRAGFKKVVFVIRRDMKKDFEKSMGNRIRAAIRVQYVFQEMEDIPDGAVKPASRTKPLGTGHALWACRKKVRDPFVMINADDFYGHKCYEHAAGFLKKTANQEFEYGMVGFALKQTLWNSQSVARAVCHTMRRRLSRIVEYGGILHNGNGTIYAKDDERVFTGYELVSMNFWAFKPSLFGLMEREFIRFLRKYGRNTRAEFFVPSVVDKLIAKKEVTVEVFTKGGPWFGITYRGDEVHVKKALQRMIVKGEYPANLWNS